MVTVLVLLVLPVALAVPSSRRLPIGFFPSPPHPWNADDFDRGRDKSIDNNSIFSGGQAEKDDYIQSYKERLGANKDIPRSSNEYREEYPIYSKEGFVPSVLSDLDKVSWWKRRYHGYLPSSPRDLAFVDDNENQLDEFGEGGFEKRDYTAAQLLNLLKAVAKARRQRQVRIAGKGLRFGISK